MQCVCNQDAKLLEVKKPGPNTGRKFYACAKPKGDQCDFFCWEGETPRGVAKRASGERTELIGKVLAQIVASQERIETRLDNMAELLKRSNLVFSEKIVPSNKEVPF